MSKSVSRLVRQFVPEHYELTITLDEDAMSFHGRVCISGKKVGRPSQRLTFHANGLKITDARVVKHDKKGEQELTVQRINLHKSFHEVRLHTGAMVYPGEYTVEMSFEAPITRGMTGIYPCFFEHDGVEKKLFATQFESHHAREAFPCIDEPEAKATFDLTLITRGGIELLSNTPIASQKPVRSAGASEKRAGESGLMTSEATSSPEEGLAPLKKSKDEKWLETRFQTTPRMSTYLLAFVTGEMQKKTARTKSGVDVNAWATVAQPTESLDYAVEVAVKSIEYFEDYFGVPYPLPKADHVALPDFSSGAMENWGLITYRERLLLAYEEDTGQSTREQIALVVAHETSHQWFGNLVTMQWWNDLWLNESFANMMEYQCVDSFHPEWNVWSMFIGSEGLSAFRRDATYGVQPVRTDVHHPDEISSLFDPSIVYAKGGRLLYMLKNYVGDEAFRKGLTAYFKKHAYGNTTGDDLWEAVSEASGKDIGAFMTPWLMRSGFPLVTVSQQSKQLALTQQQFLDDPSKADPERVWPVPLFSSSVKDLDVLDAQTQEITSGTEEPVFLNQGSAGHYLVRYTAEKTLSALRENIREKRISEADRLMALNAASMFAKAGYAAFAEALELLGAYDSEVSEPVWDMMALITAEARRFVDYDETLEPKLKAFCDQLVASQVARLGWDEKPTDSAADQKLRGLVLGVGLYAENEQLVHEAQTKFAAAKAGTLKLPAELRSLIMTIPVKYGDDEAFEYLLNLHDTTNNSDIKNDVADALTGTRDPERAAELLARLKDPKLVKPQDADRWLVYLLRNRYTRPTAWQWMVDNWDWLEETYKHDKSYDYLPRYAASCVNTPEYAEKFHALFDSKVEQPLLKRNIEMGAEEITTRIAWLTRDLASVRAFFNTI
jgi:aminopeptidase N